MSSDLADRVAHGDAMARQLLEARARVRSLGSPARGTLIAEGDSWFHYPGTDVLDALEDEFGWDVESVSHRGDNLESMAYDVAQLGPLERAMRRVHGRGTTPTGILLSGGGNDFAGSELAMLLDHVGSGRGGINAVIVGELVHRRMRDAWATLLGFTTRLSIELFGAPTRILVHGYDYPIPDGRGFLGGIGALPGPWLAPSFARKGIGSASGPGFEARVALMRSIIDDYNSMLQSLEEDVGMQHLSYVDLRGTLTVEDHRELWANELHPTSEGFRLIAAKLDGSLP